jgi:hypothetical protein
VPAGLATTAYVLLVGHETVQTSYSIKEIAPQLVLGFVAANASLLLVGRGTCWPTPCRVRCSAKEE